MEVTPQGAVEACFDTSRLEVLTVFLAVTMILSSDQRRERQH